jgi:hypothetical protein
MIAPPPGQHRHQMSAQGPGHSTQARQGCHQGEQTRARRNVDVRRTAVALMVGAFPLPITCTVAFSIFYWFDYRVLCELEKLVRTNP